MPRIDDSHARLPGLTTRRGMEEAERRLTPVSQPAERAAVGAVSQGGGVSPMAIVGGTSGNDFIHRSGDGEVSPPGFNEIFGVTTGDDTLSGLGGDDVIFGDNGNDRILGGQGVDTLHGGAGYDSFVIQSGAEISGLAEVIDGGVGGGIIVLETAGGTVNLSSAAISAVEGLSFASTAGAIEAVLTAQQLSLMSLFTLADGAPTGNVIRLSAAGAVTIADMDVEGAGFRGSSGADSFTLSGTVRDSGFTVEGLGGADVISLELDNGSKNREIVLDGGDGADVIKSKEGLNTLLGGDGNDRLTGGKREDVLNGGAGKDKLTGGGRQDTLTGGLGADTFILGQGKDSGPYGGSRDIITDFSTAEGDRIDVHAMDGDTTVDGIQPYFLAGSAFTQTAGELIQYIDGQGRTVLAGDASGDGFPEFEFVLLGGPVLTAADFIF